MSDSSLLSIGQFSALSGLTQKALRLYDEMGLLLPVQVDEQSGYRFYRPQQISQARVIGRLRQLEMPLKEIALVLGSEKSEATKILKIWWEEQKRLQIKKDGLVRYVQYLLTDEGEIMFEVKTRTIPARKMAVISKTIYQPELDNFIGDSFSKLFDYTVGAGARRPHTTQDEPTLVIYHGEVTPDSANRVDVCVPITGDLQPTEEILIQIEPAHLEAYTTLKKSQVVFPEILHAYDAVGKWCGSNGKKHGGNPREVYFCDFMAAQDDDDVTDIAFPFLDQEG